MSKPRPISENQLRMMKPFVKGFSNLHLLLYKSTQGKYFNRMGGGEICIVKMKGAKSGRQREFPLMYVPYESGLVLVASLAGAPSHPVWYHNLIAHPEIEVMARGSINKYTTRLAAANEKETIWPVCDAVYPDYALYRQRTERDIPIFVCEPLT